MIFVRLSDVFYNVFVSYRRTYVLIHYQRSEVYVFVVGIAPHAEPIIILLLNIISYKYIRTTPSTKMEFNYDNMCSTYALCNRILRALDLLIYY